MHCDDKRTAIVLKQIILDATTELQDLVKRIKTQQDKTRKMEIQDRIKYLERVINDSKDQLSEIPS